MGSAGLSGYHDEARATAPGLVVGRSGASFGKVHFCDSDYWPLNTALFATDFHGNDPRFVFLTVSQIDFQAFNSGSAQPSLNRNFIAGVPVPLPPVDEQRRIASVLGALDDKIESNRRLRQCLAETIGEIYRGAVQSVGERQPLSAVAAHHKASVQPAKNPSTLYEHFSIPAFDSGALSEVAQGAELLSGKYTLPSDAVAVSKLNPATKRVLVASPVTDLPLICSSEFVVTLPLPDMTTEVLAAMLQNDSTYYAELLSGVTGTTGSRQRVKPTDVLGATVPALSEDNVTELTETIRPLHEMRCHLHCEGRRLVEIRDGLLPKLVSGQIRVPADDSAAEELIEETAESLESAA